MSAEQPTPPELATSLASRIKLISETMTSYAALQRASDALQEGKAPDEPAGLRWTSQSRLSGPVDVTIPLTELSPSLSLSLIGALSEPLFQRLLADSRRLANEAAQLVALFEMSATPAPTPTPPVPRAKPVPVRQAPQPVPVASNPSDEAGDEDEDEVPPVVH